MLELLNYLPSNFGIYSPNEWYYQKFNSYDWGRFSKFLTTNINFIYYINYVNNNLRGEAFFFIILKFNT